MVFHLNFSLRLQTFELLTPKFLPPDSITAVNSPTDDPETK